MTLPRRREERQRRRRNYPRKAPSKVATAIVRAEHPAKSAAIRFICTPLCNARYSGSVGGAVPQYMTIGGSLPAAERNQKTAAPNAAKAEIRLIRKDQLLHEPPAG
jgi:hypothetical protein